MNHAELTISSIRARAVSAPMKRPLGTSAARMKRAPFVLLDLYTNEDVVGHAHVFCYLDLAAPMICDVLEVAGSLLKGASLKPDIIRKICDDHFMLLGNQGVIGMAISALDVACWDALSQASGLPLSQYLGGDLSSIPAYNSNGLSISSAVADVGEISDEAGYLLDQGFNAIKIRLGRLDHDEDVRAVRAARSAISNQSLLMSDYNQTLSVPDALARGADLEKEGLYWIEEPISYEDLDGNSQLTKALHVPIQNGENYSNLSFLAMAMTMKSMDYVMVDLMRIGGVSGWMHAAVLAKEAGIPMSSHLYPEVSAHLLAATPTAHWLEYVDWGEVFILNPIRFSKGKAEVPTEPGTGVFWDEDAVARYSLG